MDDITPTYPVGLEIDYPDRELDRLTTFFRVIVILPILFVLALVSSPAADSNGDTLQIGAGGILFAATAVMILFRQKYPRWWYDWNVALTRFGLRVAAFGALMRDEYPSTDAEQAVHVRISYPDAEGDLNRWLPLVKWLLAIPHFIVLALLTPLAIIAAMLAWFAILFTGRYPRGLFDFVEGVMRWWLRVTAYALLLVTDAYPPFRLRE